MPQDAFTLKFLCEELNSVLSEGKINRIMQPNFDQVVFSVYTGVKTEKLLIDVNPSNPRIGLIKEEKQPLLTAPNFCMLLRKHLSGATLKEISLFGFDRIVKITFLTSAEFSDSEEVVMYSELMGRYSNIILTKNGRVLGGNRGINMFDDGIRPIIVGKEYVLPPDKGKLVFDSIELKERFNRFSFTEEKELVSFLLENVSGIAEITAKEIVFSYKQKYLGFSAEKFFAYLSEFIYGVKVSPCVLFENGGVKDVFAYKYNCVDGNFEFYDKLCDAENRFFAEKERVKEFSRLHERLNQIVSSSLKKAKKKLTNINSKEKDCKDCERNKIFGELILSQIYKIKSGEEKAVVDNYYDNTTVEIPLDKRLSPSDNAQCYFKRYNKQKRTLEMIKPQKEEALLLIDYLESISDEISLCETIKDLYAVYEEAESFGLIKKQNKTVKERKTFFNNYEIEGIIVKVGRNNTENDKLVYSSSPKNIWFHSKDYHSSHVIAENEGRGLSDKILKTIAEICAYYSKGRNSDKTEIVYTERKNLKKPKNSPSGFWTYTDYKSISVKPDKHQEFLKV